MFKKFVDRVVDKIRSPQQSQQQSQQQPIGNIASTTQRTTSNHNDNGYLSIHPKDGHNTSDHTYQACTATLVVDEKHGDKIEAKPVMQVSGVTWNLMNKCVSKENNPRGYKNNPWNYTEDAKSYLERKTKQFAQVLEILKSGNHDFMFLQEVDCLTAPTFLKDEKDKSAYNLLKQNFIDNLKQMGWNLAEQHFKPAMAVDKHVLDPGVKPLVTLYNTKTLEPTGFKRSVLDGAGFECEFRQIKTGKNVTLVNLHLNFDGIYSNTIPSYQKQLVKDDKFAIMGGDTNHAPNDKITGLINNWNNCTNLEGNDTGEILSDTHAKSVNAEGKVKSVKKSYDCFLTNPCKNARVVFQENKAEVFEAIPGTNPPSFYIRSIDPATDKHYKGKDGKQHHIHNSAPNEPWRRGGWNEYLKKISQQGITQMTMEKDQPSVNPNIATIKNPGKQEVALTLAHPNSLFSPPKFPQPSSSEILLYRAKYGELAVKFSNADTCAAFCRAMGYMGDKVKTSTDQTTLFFPCTYDKNAVFDDSQGRYYHQLKIAFPQPTQATTFTSLLFDKNAYCSAACQDKNVSIEDSYSIEESFKDTIFGNPDNGKSLKIQMPQPLKALLDADAKLEHASPPMKK